MILMLLATTRALISCILFDIETVDESIVKDGIDFDKKDI